MIVGRIKEGADGSYLTISAGDYVIGIPKDLARELALSGDESVKREYLLNSAPAHRRALQSCLINRFPVTRADFEAFVLETGYLTDAEREGWGWIAKGGLWIKREGVTWRAPFVDAGDDLYREHGARMPVLQASWNDADAFCRWVSEKTGRSIRLPSEAEWEVSASMRGVPALEAAPLGERVVSYPDSSSYYNAVMDRIDGNGFLPPGVIWEWCADWFAAYPGGAANREYGEVYRVLRGGSLQSHPVQRTREYRFRRCPTARSPYYGFRIAMDV